MPHGQETTDIFLAQAGLRVFPPEAVILPSSKARSREHEIIRMQADLQVLIKNAIEVKGKHRQASADLKYGVEWVFGFRDKLFGRQCG